MEEKEIVLLAERALNVACQEIGKVLNIQSGDLAGRYFSDDQALNNLVGYIQQEIEAGAKPLSDGIPIIFNNKAMKNQAAKILSVLEPGEIITVVYAGSGDDGGIQEIGSNMQTVDCDKKIFSDVRDFANDLIDVKYGAYYDGEPGGGGTVTFDSTGKTIVIWHYYNEMSEIYDAPQILSI